MPRLRRFAAAVVIGGIEPVLADQCARTSIKTVLAQKLPLADSVNLRVALYKAMLTLCRNIEVRDENYGKSAHSSVVRGLYRLSADEREVLVLVAVEGLAHVEAARVLDLPQWVLLARLTRARENLQAEMARQQSQRNSRPGPSHLRVVK